MPWLSDIAYGFAETDLVRYIPSECDDRVARRVAQVSLGSDAERVAIRRSLDDDDRFTLDVFALRRATQSVRESTLSTILEAFDALLVPEKVPTGLGHVGRLVLFLAEQMSITNDTLLDRASSASPSAFHALQEGFEILTRCSTLADIGFVESVTSFGRGLLQIPEPQMDRVSGWGVAPILHERGVVYGPDVNLASLTTTLCADFEKAGWTTSSIEIDPVATDWFEVLLPGAHLDTTGCLHVSLGTADADHFEVEVWVAEVPPGDDTNELANSVGTESDDVDALAVARDRILVVMTLVPNFESAGNEYERDEPSDESEVPETTASQPGVLETLRLLVDSALALPMPLTPRDEHHSSDV